MRLGGAVALADAAAARAVHADRVHLVDIGHGAIARGEIADAVHRRDVALHGIEAFEYDQLRPARLRRGQKLFEMRHVVVAENLPLGMRLTHAFDHRIVVQGIRQDQAVRHQPGDRGNTGLVGDIAGGEDQRRFLAVQVGKLALELDQRVIIAGDVAGAAGAGAHPRRGLDHGADHLGVLAHAEVVVRAPDHDVLRTLRRMPHRIGKPAGDPLEIGKHPVTPLAPQLRQSVRKICTVIHELTGPLGQRYPAGTLFRGVPVGLSRHW